MTGYDQCTFDSNNKQTDNALVRPINSHETSLLLLILTMKRSISWIMCFSCRPVDGGEEVSLELLQVQVCEYKQEFGHRHFWLDWSRFNI